MSSCDAAFCWVCFIVGLCFLIRGNQTGAWEMALSVKVDVIPTPPVCLWPASASGGYYRALFRFEFLLNKKLTLV